MLRRHGTDCLLCSSSRDDRRGADRRVQSRLPDQGLGFVVFTVGSIAWAFHGAATGQSNLLWQNVLLTALNLFGIWRWLGRQARMEEGAATAARESEGQPTESLFPISILTKGTVLARDGTEIGKCVDAMAGCASGKISYVVVSEGGLAGVGETLRRLPWTDCMADENAVTAPIVQGELSALQTLEPDRWPAR